MDLKVRLFLQTDFETFKKDFKSRKELLPLLFAWRKLPAPIRETMPCIIKGDQIVSIPTLNINLDPQIKGFAYYVGHDAIRRIIKQAT